MSPSSWEGVRLRCTCRPWRAVGPPRPGSTQASTCPTPAIGLEVTHVECPLVEGVIDGRGVESVYAGIQRVDMPQEQARRVEATSLYAPQCLPP